MNAGIGSGIGSIIDVSANLGRLIISVGVSISISVSISPRRRRRRRGRQRVGAGREAADVEGREGRVPGHSS
jgi:hypothetical protein